MAGMDFDILEDHADQLFQRNLLIFMCDVVSAILEMIIFQRFLKIQRSKKFIQVEVWHVRLLQSFVQSIILKMTDTVLNGELT